MSLLCEKLSALDLPAYSQLICDYDSTHKTLWYYLHPEPRACFTPTLLSEILDLQARVAKHLQTSPDDIHYLILASATPQVFNLGGDLRLFAQCIQQQNRDGLQQYGQACIDAIYNNATNLGIPSLTTISLVQGTALGGGFEAALSSNVLIAEAGAQLGFPEILFNLFPGMGAYSLLTRRVNPALAERLLRNGLQVTASELHTLGVVDAVVANGTGAAAVRQFIRRHARASNANQAIQRVRERVHPLSYSELSDVLNIWVDAAMGVSAKDIRTMERLASGQDRLPKNNDWSGIDSQEIELGINGRNSKDAAPAIPTMAVA